MMMSTMTTAAPIAASAGPFAAGAPLGALTRWWVAYTTRRLEQAAIAALHAMSDQHLKEIGLTRSEIGCAVRGEAMHDGTRGRHR
jgi:uncharacterized protein YjiS (DUF1127 family)